MTTVGEDITKELKKTTRGKYARTKSERGGLQDQMNCVYAFMEGYMKEADVSSSVVEQDDNKLCVTPFKTRNKSKIAQYRKGSVQWQIGSIETQAKIWGLTCLQIFTLGEFLYCYCPGFTGSDEDFRRLTVFGRRVGLSCKGPMEALVMAKFDKIIAVLEEQVKLVEAMGHTLTYTIK